jgi:16S rRNA (uracil1498-N3)-methyltransferase
VSLPLFLLDALPVTDEFVLDGPEGHHAADVQRLRAGEGLLLGDGRGGTASAVVVSAGRGQLQVQVLVRTYEEAPVPRLVVVQAIAKGDRGELAVQAMTEVGVDAIVPWAASRSVVLWRDDVDPRTGKTSPARGERARQRWVDTAREAAKQARRAWVPEIRPAETTGGVRALMVDRVGLVLHEEATTRLSTVDLTASGDLILVIGPEGGIAPEELVAFEGAGARVVRLGTSVLRTSTAGVAALAVLSARLGRW